MPYSSLHTLWRTFLVSVCLGASLARAEILMVFSADWCGNCVKFKQDLERDPFALEPYVVEVLDFDDDKESAKQLKVTRIPTFIIYDDEHREVTRKVGYANISELKAWAQKHNAKINK